MGRAGPLCVGYQWREGEVDFPVLSGLWVYQVALGRCPGSGGLQTLAGGVPGLLQGSVFFWVSISMASEGVIK